MENRRFDSEEQDDSTPDASTKKKRGGSRLSQYLSILKNKEDKESGESTGEKGDEKPKRFRRLFGRLFPSVVEKPEEGSDKSKDYDFDPEAWFGVTQFASRAESANANPAEAADTSIDQVTPERSTTSSGSEEVNTSPVSAEAGSIEPQPVTPTEATVPQSGDIETVRDTETVLPEIQQAAPTEGELFVREQKQPEVTQINTTPEEATKEVVTERGPGMVLPVALVGLEHLGRKKADKKLEKRVNEKITATNTELGRNAALQQEVETLARQNAEQLEALKRAREGRAREVMQAAEEVMERSVPTARPERIITAEQPKIAPERTVPVPEAKEQPRLVFEKQDKEEIQPERILEQIADAAEHDLPVERIFERSHEVKDDNTVPAGAAASVGAVMNARAAAQYQTLRQAKQPVNPQGNLPVVSDEAVRAAYKQAVKKGFWAAIMIIILGSIAYLMVK
jgi:hypothetical protein